MKQSGTYGDHSNKRTPDAGRRTPDHIAIGAGAKGSADNPETLPTIPVVIYQADPAGFFFVFKIVFQCPRFPSGPLGHLVILDQESGQSEVFRTGLNRGETGKHAVCERITDDADPEFIHDSGCGEQVENRPHLVPVF